jgi:hypothetical protein
MLSNFVNNDRFSLVVLASAGAAGLLWYLRPQLGWLPLLIALVPWVIRAVAGLFLFQPTPLDLPMALFLATAAGGMWLSYDQTAAQAKYWLIIGAVLIFYALVAQPWRNLWFLAGILTLFGVGVASYFLLTHDWQAQPVRIQFFSQFVLRWMAIRPALSVDTIHPNVAAGLVAMVIPFPAAIGLRGLRSRMPWLRRVPIILFAAATGTFLFFTLLITTSRGALLATGVAFMIWLTWKGSQVVAGRRHVDPRLIFAITLTFSVTAGLILFLTYPDGPEALVNRLPGPSNVDSRVGLIRDTSHLIDDYSLFGAGLGSFPGLYSQYALILPSFVLGHSHNLLLDVTLEQGPLGLLALAAVFGGSLVLLAQYETGDRRIRHLSLLRWAIGSSLMVLLLHGLIDDPLYGSRAVLFLFLIPGMAVAVVRLNGWDNKKIQKRRRKHHHYSMRFYAAVAAAGLVLVFIFAIVNRNTIRSAWYANLGAVEMARVELSNWPTDQWDDGRNVALLAPAEDLFNKSLVFNPNNVTAHFRLGLIAMLRRDYETAVAHLDRAYQIDPTNRGVLKTLGYSYVWVGDFDHALVNLRRFREARQEMNVYITWWNSQGRPDLSDYAATMVEHLETVESRPRN